MVLLLFKCLQNKNLLGCFLREVGYPQWCVSLDKTTQQNTGQSWLVGNKAQHSSDTWRAGCVVAEYSQWSSCSCSSVTPPGLLRQGSTSERSMNRWFPPLQLTASAAPDYTEYRHISDNFRLNSRNITHTIYWGSLFVIYLANNMSFHRLIRWQLTVQEFIQTDLPASFLII